MRLHAIQLDHFDSDRLTGLVVARSNTRQIESRHVAAEEREDGEEEKEKERGGGRPRQTACSRSAASEEKCRCSHVDKYRYSDNNNYSDSSSANGQADADDANEKTIQSNLYAESTSVEQCCQQANMIDCISQLSIQSEI